MRAYAWTHLQMSAGQRGLQAAHAICRVRSTVKQNSSLQGIWDEWEENHSTMVYLNGGFSGDLLNTYNTLLTSDITNTGKFMFAVPFAIFREDGYTLNGAITAVAAIIHPRYYTPVAYARQNRDFSFDELSDPLFEGRAYCEVLRDLNHKEPNPNDHMDIICFKDYNAEEVEFMKFLSAFGLANLG